MDVSKYEVVVEPALTPLIKGGVYKVGHAQKVGQEYGYEVETQPFNGNADSAKLIEAFIELLITTDKPSLTEKYFMDFNEGIIEYFKLKAKLQELGQRIRIQKEAGVI